MPQAEGAPACRLEAPSGGRVRVSGDLGFEAAPEILEEGRRAFAGQSEVRVDLSGLTDADSAGLAVLLQWIREAHRDERVVRFEHLPKRLRDLARIGGVDGFVPGGAD